MLSSNIGTNPPVECVKPDTRIVSSKSLSCLKNNLSLCHSTLGRKCSRSKPYSSSQISKYVISHYHQLQVPDTPEKQHVRSLSICISLAPGRIECHAKPVSEGYSQNLIPQIQLHAHAIIAFKRSKSFGHLANTSLYIPLINFSPHPFSSSK